MFPLLMDFYHCSYSFNIQFPGFLLYGRGGKRFLFPFQLLLLSIILTDFFFLKY